MAHVLLEHQFTVAILGPDGCRSVDPEIEEEASGSVGTPDHLRGSDDAR